MEAQVNRAAVKRWLQGQKAATERIEEERYQLLLGLRPETALRIYLSLKKTDSGDGSRTEPSPVLVAMRTALSRYARMKRQEK